MDLPGDIQIDHLVLLQCDMDDATPELLGAVAARLLEDGARDVVLLSTMMKKGRPGVRVEVLVDPAVADHLAAVVLRETTTLGLRRLPVERLALSRRATSVMVEGHAVGVKVAVWDGVPLRAKPEFDDVVQAAGALGLSVADVYRRAAAAANALVNPAH